MTCPVRVDIECRIHIIDVLLIQLLPQQLNGFSKALEVNDLPFPEEFDHIIHIRIIGQAKNIILCDSCFLLRTKILRKVCHRIAFDLHGCCRPRKSGGRGGIHPGGMVYKIGSECGILNLRILQIPGKLVHDGTDHLQMPQFLRTDVRQQSL